MPRAVLYTLTAWTLLAACSATPKAVRHAAERSKGDAGAVGLPVAATPVEAKAPMWESDPQFAECLAATKVRHERDRCFLKLKRAMDARKYGHSDSDPNRSPNAGPAPSAGQPTTEPAPDPAPDPALRKASEGWQLRQVSGPSQQAEVEYQSWPALVAETKSRMALQLESARETKRALAALPKGGAFMIVYSAESIERADPSAWLVIVRSGSKELVRMTGGRVSDLSSSAHGFYGAISVPVETPHTSLKLYVIPALSDMRLEYELTKLAGKGDAQGPSR